MMTDANPSPAEMAELKKENSEIRAENRSLNAIVHELQKEWRDTQKGLIKMSVTLEHIEKTIGISLKDHDRVNRLDERLEGLRRDFDENARRSEERIKGVEEKTNNNTVQIAKIAVISGITSGLFSAILTATALLIFKV